jgi:hypothetical protein
MYHNRHGHLSIELHTPDLLFTEQPRKSNLGEFFVPKRYLYLGFRPLFALVLGPAAMDVLALVVG